MDSNQYRFSVCLVPLLVTFWRIALVHSSEASLDLTDDEATVPKTDELVKFAEGYHTLLEHTASCGYDKIVLITDEYGTSYDYVIERTVGEIILRSIPFIHLKVPVSMSTTYNDTSPKNSAFYFSCEQIISSRPILFILITIKSVELLDQTELCSQRELRKSGSNFRHISKWLIFLTPSRRLHTGIVIQQTQSSLDNVAMTSFTSDLNQKGKFLEQLKLKMKRVTKTETQFIPRTWTFMWRENRSRQPEEIDLHMAASNHCPLFPNIRYGLNGRPLAILIKPYSAVVSVAINDSKRGKPEYQGFEVDIVRLLAQSMNFTYTFLPKASEKEMGWEHYAGLLENGKVDLHAFLWFYHWKSKLNFSLSYPIVFEKFTGIYRRDIGNDDRSLLLIFPFSVQESLLVAGTVTYCIFILVVILVVSSYPAKTESCMLGKDGMYIAGNKMSDFALSLRKTVRKLRRFLEQMAFSFLGQPSCPEPQLMSARIIVFWLSFSSIVFYAYYTGLLTATMVNTGHSHSFQSVNEILQKGTHRCEILFSNERENRFKDVDNADYQRLEKSCEIIIPDEPLPMFLNRYLPNLDTSTLLIYYKTAFEDSLRSVDHAEEFRIIPEAVLNADRAFAFPPESELKHLFTRPIQNLQEAGVFDRIYFDSMEEKVGNDTSHAHTTATQPQQELELADFRWVFAVTCAMTSVSFLTLCAERVLIRMRCFRLKRFYPPA